jgi:hypothetical protein
MTTVRTTASTTARFPAKTIAIRAPPGRNIIQVTMMSAVPLHPQATHRKLSSVRGGV